MPTTSGSTNEFLCSTKPVWYYRNRQVWCLEGHYRCDQFTDCEDYSDEEDCAYDDCEAGKFKCGHKNATLGGICFPAEYVCNGEPNCYNKADEMGCDTSCQSHQIGCHTGDQCVDIDKRCDGVTDCADASDERYCVQTDDVPTAHLPSR